MKYLKYLFSMSLLLAWVACTEGTNETVESAYQLPIWTEPPYKFARNGESSVNTLECKFLQSPIERIYSRYMSGARLGMQLDYDEALTFYREGEFGLKPQAEIAQSALHRGNREQILADFDRWLETAARISGLGNDNPSEVRNTEAEKGRTGYVGTSIGDKDICFVDEKGLATAEIYKYAMMGSVYLDKILNVHLDDEVINSETLRTAHNLTTLLPGHNYTALEHHWDLAYGYYAFWKPLAQSEGLPALRDTDVRISRSFVKGRTYMETSHYEEMKLQVDTIRQELGRVVAVRAMNLLVGPNTLANLQETPKYALRLLSQAYGLIYATQFARNAAGKPFISYEETWQLLQTLESEGGLWEKERLLADEQQEGSLRYIASRLGAKFGISLKDIEK